MSYLHLFSHFLARLQEIVVTGNESSAVCVLQNWWRTPPQIFFGHFRGGGRKVPKVADQPSVCWSCGVVSTFVLWEVFQKFCESDCKRKKVSIFDFILTQKCISHRNYKILPHRCCKYAQKCLVGSCDHRVRISGMFAFAFDVVFSTVWYCTFFVKVPDLWSVRHIMTVWGHFGF